MSFTEKLTELRSLLRALGLSLPACLFIEGGMTPENIEPMLAMLRLNPDQLPVVRAARVELAAFSFVD